MKKSDFDFLVNLLHENAGWQFTDEQYFIIDKKMYNFVREKGYASVEELIAELKMGQKAVLWQVVEALAMSDTSFYRDYKVFKAFEETILPHIRELNRGSKKLRIWSLGCASGQEAYSIAIAVKNKLLGISDWDISIIGTDISSVAISKAQKGIYSQFEVQMGLNARMIIDNFHLEKDQWLVNDDIMSLVEFRRYNLLEDLTFSENFDIIFCRNVLHFFDKETQPKLLNKISSRQTDGGFLYLGTEDRPLGLDSFYDPVEGMKCLYQAKLIPEHQRRSAAEQAEKNIPADAVTAAGQTPPEENMPSFVRPAGLSYKRPVMADVLKK